jgi:catechol 2,3-dioxygenase-like lactoylglutathione lyase family enzyme
MELSLKVAELDHVVLRCRDIARALDFYARMLGLTEERRIEQLGLIQLRAGASMIDLVPTDRRDEAGRNVDHICLGIQTPDLREVAAFLRGAGVQVMGDPVPRYGARGMGLSIYVLDPEGNTVELKQMPTAGGGIGSA